MLQIKANLHPFYCLLSLKKSNQSSFIIGVNMPSNLLRCKRWYITRKKFNLYFTRRIFKNGDNMIDYDLL